jgi:hypothetical protein
MELTLLVHSSFYGTLRFITIFRRALHRSLFRARSIQSIPPHPSSVRSILILCRCLAMSIHVTMVSIHLRLGLPRGLFTSDFATNILHAFFRPNSCYMPFQSHPRVLSQFLIHKINNSCTVQRESWGEYMDRRETKWQEVGENFIMRSFITCALRQT